MKEILNVEKLLNTLCSGNFGNLPGKKTNLNSCKINSIDVSSFSLNGYL